ncbi:MAG: outer membrane protein assembly factor BamB family protein [Planctomycetota bacterium]|jgi:outer membrane protein assembly factor BamB
MKRLGITTLAVFSFLAVARAEDARQILSSTGVRGGLVVHLGCGDGRLTAALRLGEAYLVHGLDASSENVAAAREHVQSLGLYGKVAIDRLAGPELPYADNLVNLLVAEDLGEVSIEECLRVVAPGGVAYVKKDGQWQKTVKPRPHQIDEWTHHLHDAGGNAVAADTVVGPPKHLQWTAGPLWARSHGYTPSVTAMVSSGGRLFSIVDETLNGAGDVMPSKWFLVARDAFSGVLLWKKPVPNWGSFAMSGTLDTGGGISVGRFTMPTHAGKRLVAVGDTVYVTLGATAPVSALDAATGAVKRVYEDTARADEILVSDGRLIVSINPPKEARPPVVEKDDTPPPAPGKHVAAVDANSGRLLWKAGPFTAIRTGRGQDPFGRLELAAGDGKVFLLTSKTIECLAADSGERLWRIDRPALPADAVRRLGFSGMYDFLLEVMVYHDGVILLAQPEPNTHHTYHTMPGTLYAFDAKDGQKMWSHPYGGWGHCTPPDVFVVGDTVWTHVNADTEYGSVWGNGYRALDSSVVDYRIQAVDLRTGELRRELAAKDIFNVGHHHRCYRNKSTVRYLMASRRGVELVDLETGENFQNHWVRSGCKVGNLPANGLVYVAPHPCGCYINAKLTGFNALAPQRDQGPGARDQGPGTRGQGPVADRLQRGPAYGRIHHSSFITHHSEDWPTYRHDARRTGATEAAVPAVLETAWRADVGTAPSAPVVADGKVFVAGVDTHTVCALAADDGGKLWSYTAGGRVVAPPTLHEGLAIFGSADGLVYCLRASDGALVWRFRAAPERRLVTAFGQLESAWPVPGVLVRDGACWLAAGRSSYLDGGIHVYALEPATGKVLRQQTIYSPDPETGKMTPEPDGHTVAGLLNDVPGSDGRNVFIRQLNVSSGEAGDGRKHLFTTAGYLDSTWFNRTFWKIGPAQTTGPMVLGQGVAFGVEPFTSRSRDVLFLPGKDAYRLRAISISPTPEKSVRRGQAAKKPRQRGQAGIVWDRPVGIRITSMLRAGDVLFVAGSPDVVDPADPHGAWEGRKGGLLAAFSTSDGEPLAELELPSPPVWDGMAAAGRLYLSLSDGTVVCLRER